MDSYDEGDSPSNLKGFTVTVVFSQLLGLVLIVLLSFWLGHYRGGFAWETDLNLQFNYHPLFMVIGFILINAEALLSFRVFRNQQKYCIKVLHCCMQVSSLVFAIVGIKAVFDTHNLASTPIPNMYTLHSWLGLTTVLLFSLQVVVAFVSFMWPGISYNLREQLMPFHTFFGKAILVMAAISCLTGMTEKAFFALKSNYPTELEGKLINSMGLVLVAFVGIVLFIISWSPWQRIPPPEERHIQLSE
ncbi:transmembrane ascorbate-dependent reductase CYB561 [Octopus bimaculoides]|uniref:Cytochrome b561 domain-containing protein n=1 Tax=Octopus bimaculoides TaxID=37653 RepID=A0A0L8HY75_OCTBM|nr:transmembrane ascorbate-dependent reductase CYB561 [Octopus bimaculoides]|eukprot:XP_014768447.1 PREDICTED: cytochrome b561-like [Octopus bimaculoides]